MPGRDSHQPDKVDMKVTTPWGIKQDHWIQQSMVWLMPYQCLRRIAFLHIGTLQACHPTMTKGVGQCMPIDELWTMWKLEHANMTFLHQYTKGWRRSYCFTNSVEYVFWFYHDDIKRCISGNKKKYALDWPMVPNMWLVKIGTNVLREEVLLKKDAKFQLLQREALYPCPRLLAIAIPHHLVTFSWATKLKLPPDFKNFSKTKWQKFTTPTTYTKTNGRAHDSWMDTMLLMWWQFPSHYLELWGDCHRGQRLSCNICWHPTTHMPKFHKDVFVCFGKKMDGCTTNICTMCSYFYARWIMTTTSSKYTYNEVVRLLKLVGIVEH